MSLFSCKPTIIETKKLIVEGIYDSTNNIVTYNYDSLELPKDKVVNNLVIGDELELSYSKEKLEYVNVNEALIMKVYVTWTPGETDSNRAVILYNDEDNKINIHTNSLLYCINKDNTIIEKKDLDNDVDIYISYIENEITTKENGYKDLYLKAIYTFNPR